AAKALAAAIAGPTDARPATKRLSISRTLLISNEYFTYERIELPPNTDWCLEASQETWLLVIDGGARVAALDLAIGDALFAQSDRINMRTEKNGLIGLVAYTGTPVPELLHCVEMETTQ